MTPSERGVRVGRIGAYVVPFAAVAIGLGVGSLKPMSTFWASAAVVCGVIAFWGFAIFARREFRRAEEAAAPPKKSPEQLGKEIYVAALKPTVIGVILSREGKDIVADIARRKRVSIDMIPVIATREYVQRHGRRLDE